MNNTPYIYLLSSATDYKNALDKKTLSRPSLHTEGFIHASPKDQLTRVANKHYPKVEDLLILEVDCNKVEAEIKWEPAADSLYPHIYGELNTDSIVKTLPVFKHDDGLFHISF